MDQPLIQFDAVTVEDTVIVILVSYPYKGMRIVSAIRLC